MKGAGGFREPVTFERANEVPDAYGNPSTGWVPVPGVMAFADIRETPGRERLGAGRLEAPVTATIRLRADPYTRSIAPADRIVARGKTWNIISIGEIGQQGRVLEMLCETGGAV